MANHAVRFAWLLASLITLMGVTVSCSRDKRQGDGGGAVGQTGSTPTVRDEPSLPEEASSAAPEEPPPPPSSEETSDSEEPVASAAENVSWGLGELHDIGPAGPASAWTRGVVMVSKANELLLLPVDGQGRFRELDLDPTRFAKYGRGPALTEHFAYWIGLGGKLWRAPLKSPQNVELLHEKARTGTRVSALRNGSRELVAFVAEIDEEPIGMLWASSGELLRLTPEGSTAASVQLLGLVPPLALSLEARTGMSPIHARPLRVAPRRINLDDDRVLWVGPGSHPLTELEAVETGTQRALGFLATARTITEFGMAHFPVSSQLEPVDEARWTTYPNGIDPAPVAAARLCGGAFVFYAQPSHARPRATQELRVAALDGDHLGAPEVIARGRAFNDISVAARPNGAVLVWTADRHTWAITLTCPPRGRSSSQ